MIESDEQPERPEDPQLPQPESAADDAPQLAPGPPGDTLAAALARHQIELPAEQVELIQQYCELLWDWNSRMNLTRHTDYERFVARDLRDCLELERFLEPGELVLDVGTGGGVPGIVLSILRPDLQVGLSESVGKKARAVADIVQKLDLDVQVHHMAAQDVLDKKAYETLVVRAVARTSKLLRWFSERWDRFGRLLLIKGPSWVEERGEARHVGLMKDLELRKLATWPLSGTYNDSVLLQIERKSPLK